MADTSRGQPTLGDLAEQLATVDDPTARARARAFAAGLLELHGEAVARLLELIDAGDDRRSVLASAIEDPLVASLLVLHDLHPESCEVRVARAVEQARSQLGPIGDALGDPVLEDHVVSIPLAAKADSPQARVGVEAVLARLVRRWAPDVEAIRLIGPSPEAPDERRLLPLVTLR